MPIPANLTTVTVTGTYSNVSGVSPTGTVTFIPTQWLRDTDGDTVIPVLPHTATLTSGSFSANLVATDNEDIDQVWAYRVVETIDGAVNTFTALLPASLVSVSMADLVPVTSDPEYFSLQGPRGEQGAQGVQGETGPQGPQGDPTTVNGKTGASITLNAADVGAVANSVFTAKGSLAAASGSATPADLPVGSDGQILVADSSETVGVKWASAAPQKLSKADLFSVCLSKTGAGTAEIKAGTQVLVGSTLVTLGTATTITMPALTAGTDYYVYVKDDGTAEAVAATGSWPTPVAAPPSDSQLIGGFHYAPGGNATGTSGGDTTPAINAYSMWDLKWRPTSLDPRGMTLVADAFWMDIYHLNRDPDTNGTSKYNVDIADGATGGTTTPIIPAKFGGTGSARYPIMSWWNTAECLMAYGKRLPTVAEAAAAFYGTTENSSAGTDPVSTILRAAYTSKWGVMLATGNMWFWGQEHGGGNAAASWADTNGGRGQVYQQENAVILGGGWLSLGNSGSRSALWNDAPSDSNADVGGRGACDHMMLV